MGIIYKVLKNKVKALYLTPLRALASEKYEELEDFTKDLGLRVALTTGDYDSDDPWLSDYDIIVTTNEKADSLLRHKAQWLNDVGIVVADEVHLLNEPKRGPTLEVTLTKFKKLSNSQIIALSATIGNAHLLSKWLEAELVESTWRPVILKEGVFLNGVIYYADNSQKSIKAITGDPIGDLVLDSLREGGQVLIFVNNRRRSMSLAQKIANLVGTRLKESSKRSLMELAYSITRESRDEISLRLAECLKKGVAFHHAGLSHFSRRHVEKAFRNRIIKVVVATPTLAAGVNLPARRVIIADYKRYNSEIGFYENISVIDYKQMCGRAGRPLYDPYGEAILIAKNFRELEFLFEEYIEAKPEDISSKLASESALRVHVLALIASETIKTIKDLISFFSLTFYAQEYPIETITPRLQEVIQLLSYNNLVYLEDDFLKATPLGKRVSELYIDPYTAVILLKGLDHVKKEPLRALYIIAKTPDMTKFYLRRSEYKIIEKWIEKHEDVICKEDLYDLYDYEMFLAYAKTAAILCDWIEEKPEEAIVEKYGIGPGDLFNLIRTAGWLLYSFYELAKILGEINVLKDLMILRERVLHGVKSELIELTRLKNIGRKRARILYNAGLKTLEDIKRAGYRKLVSLPLIGPSLAKEILEQLGVKIEAQITIRNKTRTGTLEDYFQ